MLNVHVVTFFSKPRGMRNIQWIRSLVCLHTEVGWMESSMLERQHSWTGTSRMRIVHSTPLKLHLHNLTIIQEVRNGNNYLDSVLSLASFIHPIHFFSCYSTFLLVFILVTLSGMLRERAKPKRVQCTSNLS